MCSERVADWGRFFTDAIWTSAQAHIMRSLKPFESRWDLSGLHHLRPPFLRHAQGFDVKGQAKSRLILQNYFPPNPGVLLNHIGILFSSNGVGSGRTVKGANRPFSLHRSCGPVRRAWPPAHDRYRHRAAIPSRATIGRKCPHLGVC